MVVISFQRLLDFEGRAGEKGQPEKRAAQEEIFFFRGLFNWQIGSEPTNECDYLCAVPYNIISYLYLV
jgi:hypothetical protein